MNEKNKITVIICKTDEWCDDWPSENVLEFAEWFNRKIGQIPEEYRKTSKAAYCSPLLHQGSCHAVSKPRVLS